jgi:hypothetical protein
MEGCGDRLGQADLIGAACNPQPETRIPHTPRIRRREHSHRTTLTAGGGTRRSRGHWGTLDNVIGAPGKPQRVSRDLRP